MAIHPLVYLPDLRLRAATKVVSDFGPPLQTLIDEMFETMYHAHGIGLAAPQIGVALKLAVIDVEGDGKQKICLINPEIIEREGSELMSEGCLSVPGVYDKAPRATKVKMRALDRQGHPFELVADGLLAHCIQHEIDHLHGKLFVDYLSPLKRNLARKKLEKFKRRK